MSAEPTPDESERRRKNKTETEMKNQKKTNKTKQQHRRFRRHRFRFGFRLGKHLTGRAVREEVSGQRLDFGRAVAGLRRFEAPAGLHVKQQRSLVVAEQPRKAAVAHAEILKKQQQKKPSTFDIEAARAPEFLRFGFFKKKPSLSFFFFSPFFQWLRFHGN